MRSKHLFTIALVSLLLALALVILVLLSGSDVATIFSENFALFSILNNSKNPEIIPQFEKIVFLTWGSCLMRSATAGGTICSTADLMRQITNIQFNFALPIPVPESRPSIDFFLLAKPMNNSLVFLLAASSALLILITIVVLIAVLYEPRPKLPLHGLKQPKQKIILAVSILTIISNLAASANLVLVMIVYGTFSARGVVPAQTEINANTLPDATVNDIGGFIFGNSFGLGTIFIGLAAILTLVAVISTIRGLFVYRMEFTTIPRGSSPNPFDKDAESSAYDSQYETESTRKQEYHPQSYNQGFSFAMAPPHPPQQVQQAESYYENLDAVQQQQPQYYSQYNQQAQYNQPTTDLYSSGYNTQSYAQPVADTYSPTRAVEPYSSLAYQTDSEEVDPYAQPRMYGNAPYRPASTVASSYCPKENENPRISSKFDKKAQFRASRFDNDEDVYTDSELGDDETDRKQSYYAARRY